MREVAEVLRDIMPVSTLAFSSSVRARCRGRTGSLGTGGWTSCDGSAMFIAGGWDEDATWWTVRSEERPGSDGEVVWG